LFSPSNSPPEWAGCCTREGRVIYNGEYVNRVLCGDGYYGGHRFDVQYFYREFIHELSHQDLNISIFGGSEEMIDFFAGNSNWVFEGLAELTPGIRQSTSDFRRLLQTHVGEHPDFSSQDLNGDFWRVDDGPAGLNLAYQYSARLVRRLASILSQLYYKSTGYLNTKPYGGLVCWWEVARNRYLGGQRESFIDAVEDVASVRQGTLLSIERQWRSDVLNGTAE